MKLHAVGLIGVVLAGVTSIGCGPGLGHHGRWAQAPTTDAVGTTTLSSDAIPLPASRMSLSAVKAEANPWDDDAEADPSFQTWGAPPSPEDKYGF
jgi:hypothetical protein